MQVVGSEHQAVKRVRKKKKKKKENRHSRSQNIGKNGNFVQNIGIFSVLDSESSYRMYVFEFTY